MIKMTQITENEVSGDNELVFRFPSNHFTLEEFDAWFAREARGFRAALISYGDIFIESKTKRVDKPKASTAKVLHSIDLGANDIKFSYDSNTPYIVINGIQKLKASGVTDLGIIYNDFQESVYHAHIPITDLTQKSLQITFKYNSLTYSYVPNTKTRWGSFFRLIKDKVA